MQAIFKGQKVKELRMRKGLSCMGLARKIDPSSERSLSVSIKGYEDGKNIPSCVMLYLISQVLGCEMSEFVELTNK